MRSHVMLRQCYGTIAITSIERERDTSSETQTWGAGLGFAASDASTSCLPTGPGPTAGRMALLPICWFLCLIWPLVY